jgi:hypothetical protein
MIRSRQKQEYSLGGNPQILFYWIPWTFP